LPEDIMRAVRTIAAVLVAAAIAVTGCTIHAPRPPTHRADTTLVDRQAPIYAAVLRQYLTSGGGHDGGDAGYGGRRFPRIFVLDHAMADANTPGHGGAVGGPIAGDVRRAMTLALADVGPLSFVPSSEAALVPRSCAEVRDRGILITLGPVDGAGDQVQVSIYGHVSCIGANSLVYRVERTTGGWRVAGVVTMGPVA
jgi:hypothetical protein